MTSVLYGWLNIDVVNTLARAPTNPACTYTRRTADSDKGSQTSTSLSPTPAKQAASRSRSVSMGRSNASLTAPRWRLRSLANEISTSLISDHVKAMGLLHTQLNEALWQMHVYTDTAELLSSYSEEQIEISCIMGCKPCVSTRGVSSPDSPLSCLPSMRAPHLSTLAVFAIGTDSKRPPASSSNHAISQSA